MLGWEIQRPATANTAVHSIVVCCHHYINGELRRTRTMPTSVSSSCLEIARLSFENPCSHNPWKWLICRIRNMNVGVGPSCAFDTTQMPKISNSQQVGVIRIVAFSTNVDELGCIFWKLLSCHSFWTRRAKMLRKNVSSTDKAGGTALSQQWKHEAHMCMCTRVFCWPRINGRSAFCTFSCARNVETKYVLSYFMSHTACTHISLFHGNRLIIIIFPFCTVCAPACMYRGRSLFSGVRSSVCSMCVCECMRSEKHESPQFTDARSPAGQPNIAHCVFARVVWAPGNFESNRLLLTVSELHSHSQFAILP